MTGRRRKSGRAAAAAWVLLFALCAPVEHVAAAGPPPAPQPTMKLGVVGFYNPRLMYLKYQPLADYLSDATPYRWELAISNTYDKTVRDLCEGRVALAYLGPLTYVLAHHRCDAVPLVRLNSGNKSIYRSVILVREDSPYRNVNDLRGKRFAFGAFLSTSSHLVPRAMLEDAGSGRAHGTEYTYYRHHERAARAVLLDEADACGIRDIVAEKFVKRGLREIERSAPIANFPLVVPASTPQELREMIVAALVEDPAWDETIAERISTWDAELAGGFALTDDGEFDSIRQLAARIFGPGYLQLPLSVLERGEFGD